MDDNEIIKLFIRDNGKLLLNYLKTKWLDSHIDIKKYLEYRFSDITFPINYSEIIYRIKYGLENIPYCIVCGKPTKFKNFSKGYSEYCSHECSVKSKKRSEKFKITYNDRYGNLTKDEYKTMYNWTEERVKKALLTCLEKYGNIFPTLTDTIKEKIQGTFLKNYGVINPNKLKEIRNKIELTNLSKYGNINAMKSNIVKKKLSISQKSDEVKNKKIATWLLNYNVDNPVKCPEVIDKIFTTKKKRNSCNSSKYELYVCRLFDSLNIEYMRNYKSAEYPFHCDFFLPLYNLYIELNITWTHGFKPYIENDIECKLQLNIWKEKSVNSDYYKDAIKTWTIRDVRKRSIAKKHNLNYLEIFSHDLNEITENILSYVNIEK